MSKIYDPSGFYLFIINSFNLCSLVSLEPPQTLIFSVNPKDPEVSHYLLFWYIWSILAVYPCQRSKRKKKFVNVTVCYLLVTVAIFFGVLLHGGRSLRARPLSFCELRWPVIDLFVHLDVTFDTASLRVTVVSCVSPGRPVHRVLVPSAFGHLLEKNSSINLISAANSSTLKQRAQVNGFISETLFQWDEQLDGKLNQVEEFTRSLNPISQNL